MKHLVEHSKRFFCVRACLVLWNSCTVTSTPEHAQASLPWLRWGFLWVSLKRREKAGTRGNDWADRPLHPAARLWEGQLPAALLGSASTCKPKQQWQQQTTIFNYTAGIICSLKNSLIVLCLTTSPPFHSNQVLSTSPQQHCATWNTSASFLESFPQVLSFRNPGSLDIYGLSKSETHAY